MSDRKQYLINEIWHKENVLKASKQGLKTSKNMDGLEELFTDQIKKLKEELAPLRAELKSLEKVKNGKNKKLSKNS